jgi:hypothetical protein
MGRLVGHHPLDDFAAVTVKPSEAHAHAVQAVVGTGLVGSAPGDHAFAAQRDAGIREHDLKSHGAADFQRLAHGQEQPSPRQVATKAGDKIVQSGVVQGTAQGG